MSSLIITYHGDLTETELLDFVNGYIQHSSNSEDIMSFFRHFIDWYNFGILKPAVISYLAGQFENTDAHFNILEFLVEIVFSVDPKSKLCKCLEQTFQDEELIDFQSPKKKIKTHGVLLNDLSVDLWKENPSKFWILVTILTRLR